MGAGTVRVAALARTVRRLGTGAASADAGDGVGWWVRAACKGQVELFDDESAEGHRRARAMCRGCPVRVECLREAVLNGDVGIRGGLTTPELEKLRVRLSGSAAAVSS